MELSGDLFRVANMVIQWFIVPLVAVVWTQQKQIANHDKEFTQVFTLLEERQTRRNEDRIEEARVLAELREGMKELRAEVKSLRELTIEQAAQATARTARTARGTA